MCSVFVVNINLHYKKTIVSKHYRYHTNRRKSRALPKKKKSSCTFRISSRQHMPLPNHRRPRCEERNKVFTQFSRNTCSPRYPCRPVTQCRRMCFSPRRQHTFNPIDNSNSLRGLRSNSRLLLLFFSTPNSFSTSRVLNTNNHISFCHRKNNNNLIETN